MKAYVLITGCTIVGVTCNKSTARAHAKYKDSKFVKTSAIGKLKSGVYVLIRPGHTLVGVTSLQDVVLAHKKTLHLQTTLVASISRSYPPPGPS